MSAEFDPYYLWLGIPPAEQPPNHYRLLGIVLFESNRTVIETAADRQMTFLRQYGTGQHSDASQKLLNEVSAALIVLLNPKKKADYDERLKAQLGQTSDETPDEPAPLPFQIAGNDTDRHRTKARRSSRWLPLGIAGLVSAAAGIALGSFFSPSPQANVAPGGDGALVIQAAAGLSVRLDGEEVSADRLRSPIELSSGKHAVELRKGDSVVDTASFWIDAGETTNVELRDRTPAVAKPPAESATASNSKPENTTATKIEPVRPGNAKPPQTAATAPRVVRPALDKPPEDLPGEAQIARDFTAIPKPLDLHPEELPKESPLARWQMPDLSARWGAITLRERLRIDKPDENVINLALAPDASTLAAQTINQGSQSGTIHLWSTSTGKAERFTIPVGTANTLPRFDTDGGRLLFIGLSKTQATILAACPVKTGKSVQVVQLSPATTSRPSRVKEWAISDDEETALFSLVPQSGGTQLGVAISYWDLKKKREVRYSPEPVDEISCIALSHDGELAAAAFRAFPNSKRDIKESIRVWNLKSREVLHCEAFEEMTLQCTSLRFSEDDSQLLIAGPKPGQFELLDLTKKEETPAGPTDESRLQPSSGAALARRARISTKPVNGWRGNRFGTVFITGTSFGMTGVRTDGRSSEIRVFDYLDGGLVAQTNVPDISADLLTVSKDGNLSASTGRGAPIVLWELLRQ